MCIICLNFYHFAVNHSKVPTHKKLQHMKNHQKSKPISDFPILQLVCVFLHSNCNYRCIHHLFSFNLSTSDNSFSGNYSNKNDHVPPFKWSISTPGHLGFILSDNFKVEQKCERNTKSYSLPSGRKFIAL